MKILLIQENGRHAGNRNFRECFCMQRALVLLGHECDVWGLGHPNFKQRPAFNQYDAIVNLENYDVKGWVPPLSGAKKPFKMLWVIDAHVRTMKPYRRTFVQGKYDLILQATRNYVDKASVWFPNCYDHTLIRPMPSVKKVAGVGFCGNIVTDARKGHLQALRKRYDWFQQDIFVIGKKMVEAINSYHVHFNCNIANDVNYRNFETMGCSVPLVTNANDQYAALGLVDEHNCMVWRNRAELFQKIDLLLADSALRSRIAAAGYSLAAKHTYEVRAKTLVDLVQEK